jgi:hypothetical protein
MKANAAGFKKCISKYKGGNQPMNYGYLRGRINELTKDLKAEWQKQHPPPPATLPFQEKMRQIRSGEAKLKKNANDWSRLTDAFVFRGEEKIRRARRTWEHRMNLFIIRVRHEAIRLHDQIAVKNNAFNLDDIYRLERLIRYPPKRLTLRKK